MKKILTVLGLIIGTTMLMGAGTKDDAGCDGTPDSSQVEQAQQEVTQKRLLVAQPAPRIEVSMERRNLTRRLERLNTENMSGYVYLLTQSGTVVAFYPVKGKITSLNSYLSGQEKIVNDPHGSTGVGSLLMESPDYDGAYGKNSDGVFFFTADTDTYVEWKGDYMFTDAPVKLAQQPIMIREIKN